MESSVVTSSDSLMWMMPDRHTVNELHKGHHSVICYWKVLKSHRV